MIDRSQQKRLTLVSAAMCGGGLLAVVASSSLSGTAGQVVQIVGVACILIGFVAIGVATWGNQPT